MAGDPVWEGDMGRNWARLREATDRQLAEVGEAGLNLLNAKPGERVLDLGCGGGTTTLAIAGAVGPSGRVTGVDISPDLVAHARQRLEAFPHATVIEADAASHPFEPASHDALFSRHGCMFFTDALGRLQEHSQGPDTGCPGRDVGLHVACREPLGDGPARGRRECPRSGGRGISTAARAFRLG